ncbi:HlyD family efflux transporter periplasmic adaptor subunit [Litorimonas sp. RW-G-Af-16]|uniref:HlyD family efflux transporter periplasmic adaptor subunit n=1 Tax=Litorimonas sp. RW-G-Af-16 TaxID=3241168 RepID=UPI00390C555A
MTIKLVAPKPDAKTSAPQQAQAEAPPSPLQLLLQIEGEALNAKDHLSLKHLAVNRPKSLLKCGHIIWVSRLGQRLTLEAISGIETIDKQTPFARWLHGHLLGRAKNGDLQNRASFVLGSRRANDAFDYPFEHACFVPFAPNPKRGGLLFTRDEAFEDKDAPIMLRLSQIFGMVDAAMQGRKRSRMSARKRTVLLATCAILAAIACIPVPMTTLAPAEIIAADPHIITAPMEGVVQQILVKPNALVAEGTPLVQFEDVALRNEYLLAQQELQLADARRRKAGLTAFIDGEAKREIAIADAEAKLAAAKLNYTRDRLSRTMLLAPKGGLALYTNPSDWTGRPVTTGEAIIQIAEPTRVLLRIDAPLAHGEALQSGARVRMFLDSDPVNALDASLLRASFHASPSPESGMVFEAFAKLDNDVTPRIGARGVAKIYGEKAPLGYWLARRPLTLLRQMTGL